MDDRRKGRKPGRLFRRFGRPVPGRSARILLSTLLAGLLTLTLPTPQAGPSPRTSRAPETTVASGGHAGLPDALLAPETIPAPTALPIVVPPAPPTFGSRSVPAQDDERHHLPPHLPYQAAPPTPAVVSAAPADADERHHLPPYLAFSGNPSPAPEVTPAADSASVAATPAPSYIVRSGDTLSGIAARFGMTVDTLVVINRLPARNYIWPGEVLAITGSNPAPALLPAESRPTPTLLPIADAPATPTPLQTSTAQQQADLLPQAAEVIVEFGHYPWGAPHYGLDLQVPSGTAVTAPVSGVVVEVATGCVVGAVTCGNGWGNHVWWRSALTGHYLLVAHFTTLNLRLAPGGAITAGTLLGYSGTTGYSTGPHVHIQASTSGPNDASAFDPSLELPWETCGHPIPHLGDAWGSTSGCY